MYEELAAEKYEMVDHPTHYNKYDIEVVEMIKRVWNPFIASKWCEINAFKYRMRLGEKPDNPIEQDIKKENVYLDLYNKYKNMWKSEPVYFEDLTKEEQEYILSIKHKPTIEEKKETKKLITD